jgi:hypothetical protein
MISKLSHWTSEAYQAYPVRYHPGFQWPIGVKAICRRIRGVEDHRRSRLLGECSHSGHLADADLDPLILSQQFHEL